MSMIDHMSEVWIYKYTKGSNYIIHRSEIIEKHQPSPLYGQIKIYG